MINKKERLMKVMLDHDNILVTTLLEKLKRTSEFENELSFGTSGVRGEVGIGTNKINDVTIAKFVLDLVNYVITYEMQERGILIFYDTRYTSKHFADLTAKILIEKEIKVRMSKEPSPTPVLSYAMQRHDYFLGIMITASHNPYTDNGFKVYNAEGSQITAKELKLIKPFLKTSFIEAAAQIDNVSGTDYSVKTTSIYEKEYQSYLEKSIKRMNNFMDLAYLDVVYSPLHGAGYSLVPEISKSLSFLNLVVLEEQAVLDGFFKTVDSPNPENQESFKRALIFAGKSNVDTILLTDPDGDRFGAAVKKDIFKIFSGNEIGILFLVFLLEIGWKDNQGTLLSSIVSSDLPDLIGRKNLLEIDKTLTGFKYIGEYISEGTTNFYFAFEESGGYLFFDKVHEKDGVQAALVFSTMKAYYDYQHKSLEDKLQEIYNEYGYFSNQLTTTTTIDFNELSKKIYQALTANQLPEVWMIEDYQAKRRYKDEEWNVLDKFPASPLLKVYFSIHEWVAFRPSGTENYFKIYQQSWGKELEAAHKSQTKIQEFLDYFINLDI